MSNPNFLHLLLPAIAFHIAYFMSIIQGHILDFPLPDGPSIPLPDFSFGRYLYKLTTSLPEIILSYIYLILCRNNIRNFKIITPLFIVSYILLLSTSDSFGLIYIFLLTKLHYWIPFFLLFMIFFVRYKNNKILQYWSLGLSIGLFTFAYFIFSFEVITSDTPFWSKIHRIYWVTIYLICYLLCQSKKPTILIKIIIILMLSASIILEFGTPLNHILTTQFLILLIIFCAEMFARRYKSVPD